MKYIRRNNNNSNNNDNNNNNNNNNNWRGIFSHLAVRLKCTQK